MSPLVAYWLGVLTIAVAGAVVSLVVLGRKTRDHQAIEAIRTMEAHASLMAKLAETNERVTRDAMDLAKAVVAPETVDPRAEVEEGLKAMFSAFPEVPEDDEEERDWTEDYIPSDRQEVGMTNLTEPMPSTGLSVVDILGKKLGVDGPEGAG